MRNLLLKIIEFLFYAIVPKILNFYERFLKYRIMEAWGVVHLKKIKNKGLNVKIVGYSRILDPDRLKLGSNVRIGYDAFLFCRGGVSIGNNCIISRGVTIYSANHNYEGDALPFDDQYKDHSVVIEDNVWIGMGVMITPGVKIGEGSIIAMGSVVSKDVEKYSIVASSKQYALKYRDIDRYERNLSTSSFFSVRWPNR